MKKYYYHSKYVRHRVVADGTELIIDLQIYCGLWYGWCSIRGFRNLRIRLVANYSKLINGMVGAPMTLEGGGCVELWPADQFDLRQRLEKHLQGYNNVSSDAQKISSIIKNKMDEL